MVPNGFQHVLGLGNFPSDWLIASADEITEKITKGTTPPKSEIVDDKKIPFLRVNNLGFNGSLKSNSEMLFVTEDAHNGFLSRSIAYPNDILMNIVGPPLGKIAMLGSEYPEYNMNQAVLIYRCKEQLIDNGYFLSFLGSELAQQWLQSRSKKTSGQQNLTIQLCKELPTPVPPLPEQRKIAKILSTWDKAITTTEKLIETSKQQKKALMQQLLTGKKRLVNPETRKEFVGEWESSVLNRTCKISKGKQLNRSTLNATGQYPVINGGITPSGYTDSFNTVKNTITISEGGNSCGYIDFQKKDFWCGGHCYNLKDVTIDLKYLYQYLKFSERKIMSLRVGSGLPNIQKKAIENVPILYPSEHEQRKIASILTAADKEIEILTAKLAHFKQEKKALMQQLLTGKRRVKIEEMEVA
ncbi:restriction endonuclease subunit S [Vibrio parahaemolyticus]|nr:restriction endonuclease subunit S [Vibrio parahaemolyticus]